MRFLEVGKSLTGPTLCGYVGTHTACVYPRRYGVAEATTFRIPKTRTRLGRVRRPRQRFSSFQEKFERSFRFVKIQKLSNLLRKNICHTKIEKANCNLNKTTSITKHPMNRTNCLLYFRFFGAFSGKKLVISYMHFWTESLLRKIRNGEATPDRDSYSKEPNKQIIRKIERVLEQTYHEI